MPNPRRDLVHEVCEDGKLSHANEFRSMPYWQHCSARYLRSLEAISVTAKIGGRQRRRRERRVSESCEELDKQSCRLALGKFDFIAPTGKFTFLMIGVRSFAELGCFGNGNPLAAMSTTMNFL